MLLSMRLSKLSAQHLLCLDFEEAGFDAETLELVAREVDELESVLGCRGKIGVREPGEAAWVVKPRREGTPPALSWEPDTLSIVSSANSTGEMVDTMQLLHTLVRNPDIRAEFRGLSSTTEAARRICDEILGSYPYFELRDIDPVAWASTALGSVPTEWGEFRFWAQEWVAQLGDAHTAVLAESERGFNPPYVGSLGSDGVVLESVPVTSAASRAGVGAGWVVEVDDPSRWLRTTGATPQQHAKVVARRALAIHGAVREFRACPPGSGEPVTWTEHATTPVLSDVMEVGHSRRDAIRVRLHAFRPGIGIEDAFDDLCRKATPATCLELDLRGNTGGNLVLATRLRDRFLREPTHIGSITFSTGQGSLAATRDRWAVPSCRPCWPGSLTILVDSMTYSAAEDFVLGLQGLPHVTVHGEQTGGGSGRPRSIPLGPGLGLRISTAITRDRHGRPVEFYGITPD